MYYEQSLRAATTAGDERVRAMALMLLGIIELKAGDPSEAVARHREALGIVEQLTPVPDGEVARIRGNLGNALVDLGEARDALAEQEAALAIKERIYPAPHWELAETIGNLGNAQRLSGDTAGAISSYERELSMERPCMGRPIQRSTRASLISRTPSMKPMIRNALPLFALGGPILGSVSAPSAGIGTPPPCEEKIRRVGVRKLGLAANRSVVRLPGLRRGSLLL
jgi:tetratricopeptide (TPR) repeat protein